MSRALLVAVDLAAWDRIVAAHPEPLSEEVAEIDHAARGDDAPPLPELLARWGWPDDDRAREVLAGWAADGEVLALGVGAVAWGAGGEA